MKGSLIKRYFPLVAFAVLLLIEKAASAAAPKVTKFFMIEPESLLMYRDCNHEIMTNWKHFDAVFFIDALREHGGRVYDIEDAEIVFVPALLDAYSWKHCSTENTEEAYINDTIRVINKHGAYPAKRHVMFKFDFMYSPKKFRAALPRLIFTSFEDFGNDCDFAVGYANNYDSAALFNHESHHRYHLSRQGHDNVFHHHLPHLVPFKDRKLFVEFTGQADRRPNYSDRRLLFTSSRNDSFDGLVWITTTSSTDPDWVDAVYGKPKPSDFIPRCTIPDPTPEMVHDYVENGNASYSEAFNRCLMVAKQGVLIHENAQFSLCFRGDTPGADRWFNAFISRTMIVAVSDTLEQGISWVPFKDVIPWSEIVIWLNRKEYVKNPVKTINSLRKISYEEIEKRWKLMNKHIADISFIAPESRFTDNFIRAAATCSCSYYGNHTTKFVAKKSDPTRGRRKKRI